MLTAPTRTAVERAARRPVGVVRVAALAAIVIVGVWLRLAGLTSRGLFRDDAWVALSSRVSLGTALRMGATAPGFTVIERAWILLDPGSSMWAQALPVALGAVAIVAMYLLSRYVGLSTWLSLATAAFVAFSPVTIGYSSHVKQYSTDLVLACALLGLGEAARRRPERRELASLAAASCMGLTISASVGVVVVGVWAMLLVTSRRDRDGRVGVITYGAITAGACAMVGFLFYGHLSTALHLFWSQQHRFLEVTPIAKFVPRFITMPSTAILRAHSPRLLTTWVGIGLTVVALVGLTTGAEVWASGLAMATGVAAAVMALIPWGTGRTDMALYPALALLVAFGVKRIVDGIGRRAPSVPVEAIVAVLIVAVLALGMLRAAVEHPAGYPAFDVAVLRREITAHEHTGDLVYVSSSTRYQWALQSPGPPRLEFGPGWGAGYTVTSTRSDQFIAPSYSWEVDYRPTEWARRTTTAERLWFVGGGWPPNPHDPEYRAILAAGWRPVMVLRATGCIAALMIRS